MLSRGTFLWHWCSAFPLRFAITAREHEVKLFRRESRRETIHYEPLSDTVEPASSLSELVRKRALGCLLKVSPILLAVRCTCVVLIQTTSVEDNKYLSHAA